MKTTLLFLCSIIIHSPQARANDGLVGSAEAPADGPVERIVPEAPARDTAFPEPSGDTGGRAKPVEATNKKLYEQVKAHAGSYVLAANSKEKPCHFNFGLKEGEEIRLNATVAQKDDEFGQKAGDVNLELRQFSPELNREVRVFDRADFSALNGRSKSSRVGALKISHTASYTPEAHHPVPSLAFRDPSERAPQGARITLPERTVKSEAEFSHTVAMSQLGHGKSEATQKILFDADGGFEYNYTLSEGRFLKKKETAGRCRFKKKQ